MSNSKSSQNAESEPQQQDNESTPGESQSQNKQAQPPSKPAQPAVHRPPTTPSAAAIQRALAGHRQPTTSLDGVLEGTRDRLATSGTSSPSWPTSPRLKSPPPSTTRPGSRRDSSEQAQSNTAKRLAPVSAPEMAAAMLLPEQSQSSTHLRVPPRGTSAQNPGLETVVEGSAPNTPSVDSTDDPMESSQATIEGKGGISSTATSSTVQLAPKPDPSTTKPTYKADNDQKSRAPTTSRLPSNLTKRSFTSLTGSKKFHLEPVRTMTVETEEVSATTPGLGDRNRDGGSVRTKTSTETIRPKKEKKKPVRKAASLHAGITSKADIFEAKVASAVDEADTSDSDETFVYESNPPEPQSRRHHSRTPSATSMASTSDQYRGNKQGMRNGSTAIPGKKSMKFGNSIHQREYDEEPNRGGVRNTSSTPRHHHIGRYGRSNHASLFDNESPFSQARQPNSPRSVTGNPRSSLPNSPRVGNGKTLSPRKYGGGAYDNGEDVADDERAPLIGGTVRINRSRHSKHPHSRDFRSMEFGEDDERGWTRCGSCVLLVLLVMLICAGLASFAVTVNRPLFDVEVRRIANVLSSEQELMLDLDVKAVNPNIFTISVTDLDINLFAESPYVGTTENWHREHDSDNRLKLRPSISDRRKRSWWWPEPPHTDDGVDEGTDPEDPENGIQKMLLGRVSEFDSPLTFDPSPMRRNPSASVGEIRLSKPGNKTEVGGSQRWERVLQHDFDLIVRGVIKYQLPLSSKMKSAKISSRKTVHPDSEGKKDHAW